MAPLFVLGLKGSSFCWQARPFQMGSLASSPHAGASLVPEPTDLLLPKVSPVPRIVTCSNVTSRGIPPSLPSQHGARPPPPLPLPPSPVLPLTILEGSCLSLLSTKAPPSGSSSSLGPSLPFCHRSVV